MQVKSIAECSKGSILQFFRPSLSYHLSLRSLFCLLLSGRLRQVLLYINMPKSRYDLIFMVCYLTFPLHEIKQGVSLRDPISVRLRQFVTADG